MPTHYGSSMSVSTHNDPEKKSMKPKSTMKMEKKEMPKRKSAMRKMSDKEKKLLKEHFEKHEPNASKSRKAQIRMMVMRTGVDVKTMKGLHKLVGR
tara:strand:- start:300 stop:587 length:288 start_codon:yes stop_codon:yes gene_type:complete